MLQTILSVEYFINAIRYKYADFSGRARRSEYWLFGLFSLLISIACIILDYVLGTDFWSFPYGLFYVVFGVATFLPGLAVSVRRLHDVGKSGWFLLLIFIPIIGAIWLLVLFCTDSENGPNEFGPNPKGLGNPPGDVVELQLQ